MSELLYTSCLGPHTAEVLVPPDAVVLGGTELLDEFFQLVSRQDEGELAICAPFIDEGFTRNSAAWEVMKHSCIDVRLVTRGRQDAANAWSALRVFPWLSVTVCQSRRLHAKVYSFVSSGGGVALIGSHNLTREGFKGNIEAGVLFKALCPGLELRQFVLACHDHVARLARRGTVFADSGLWPGPSELQQGRMS